MPTPSTARPQSSPQAPVSLDLTIEERVAAEWERQGPQRVDWLGFENVLRAVLRSVPVAQRTGALYWIDEALAAFTRRGNVYDDAVRGPDGTWRVKAEADTNHRATGAAILGPEWAPHQTGGGCMAWRKALADGDELLLSSEAAIDVDPNAHAWIASRYAESGAFVESPCDLTLVYALGVALVLEHPDADEGFIPRTRRFTLHGKPIDLAHFIEEHGLAMPDLEQIRSLEVGEALNFTNVRGCLERVA